VSHSHDLVDSRREHSRTLTVAFVLVAVFVIVELVVGLLSGSLALTADAGHMAADALGIGMALAAAVAVNRSRPDATRTYGLYRFEIVAALANAVLLLGLSAYVLYQAIQRFASPTEVAAGPMLAVAVVGLGVNLFMWRLLRPGARASLNVEGAYLEVLGDLIASIGVVVAATIVLVTGWTGADSLVAVGIGLFIVPRALRLAAKAIRILTQSVPAGLDPGAVAVELAAIPGVVDVHDLHVWTLTSGMDVATAHLVVGEGTDTHPVLDRARDLMKDAFGISHATFQLEPDTHRGCDEIDW